MTTLHSTDVRAPATVASHAMLGGAGGLVGGVAFGLLMQHWGMIPMIAKLVDSSSTSVGWTVHLVIAAGFGVAFGVVLGNVARRTAPAVVLGVLYGAMWWVLGALWLMPARLGMPLFNLNQMAWRSFGGHLVYGALLGLTFAALHTAMPCTCKPKHL